MKPYLKFSILILCGLLSSSAVADPKWKTPYMRCVPFDEEGRKVSDEHECPKYEVSIIQLLARPELYDGKRVIIHGFVHLEFEGRGIYIRKEDHESSLTHNGLWVGAFREGARVKNCQDNYVTLIGVFRAQDYGHMSGWSGAIEDISVCMG